MAIELIESFANLATADLVLKGYTNSGSVINAGSGRWAGPSLRMTSTNHLLSATVNANATMGCAIAFKGSSFVSALALIGFFDSATLHVDIRILADGTIRATRNGTTLGTSTNALTTNVWYHIEAKVLIADSGGTVDVWVNGVNWLALSSQDTRNAASAQATVVRLNAPSNGTWDYSDWVVWSGATGQLGDMRVVSKLPNGAGANTQWTASAGANYTDVDETNQNGDTDYVSDATAGHRDTYAFAAMGVAVTSVKAVQVNVWAEKTDAGARTIAPVIRRSSTNYDGTAQSPSAGSYAAVCKQVYETDPSTSLAWTDTNIDAGEYGVKLVS